MSAAYDVATYISATLGEGTIAVDLFVNGMYDSPNTQIAVYEYGGKPADLAMGAAPDADALEWASIQIAVRALNPSTAQSRAYTIYKAMDGLGPVTINSVYYFFFRANQPPFLLERDEQKRVTFVFNLDLQKKRS